MTVTLTPEQEKFIAEQVKSGRYQSADDIIAQSLGILRAQEEFIRSSSLELREQIAIGVEEIQKGQVVDGRSAIKNIREKLHARKPGNK